ERWLVAGIFPATMVYPLPELAERGPELARTLREGKLPEWLRLSAEQRATFQRDFPAHAKAAGRLERAARAPEEEKAAEAWPDLRLVYCWTGATAGLYLSEIQRRWG